MKNVWMAGLAFVSVAAMAVQPSGEISPLRQGDQLVWSLPADHAGATLNLVHPNGVVERLDFAAGSPIVLDLADRASVEGQYLYELNLSPVVSEGQRQRLQDARARGQSLDLGLSAQRISGAFRFAAGNWEGVGAIPDSAVLAEDGETDRKTDEQIAAQLLTGDVSINNSLCVGNDCGTGEVFGFDTIRMRENNNRITFIDTSNSGSFAAGDWGLEANGSNNGDPDYFSLVWMGTTAGSFNAVSRPFRVDGGAPNDALRVDSEGDVGIGTPSPVVELHVRDGDTPTLRLEQNDSSGFTPQTWDLAGNETNFFVRDVTNGSLLSFRIRPGAPESSIDIAADGDVGIGTGSPQARLHVAGGDLRVDGAVYQLSSRSAKTDLVAMSAEHLLELLSGLDLFNWRYLSAAEDDRHFGPTSEDFYRTFGLGSSEHHISVADMAGVALGAAQALQQELSDKERELDEVRARLERLEQLLESSQN